MFSVLILSLCIASAFQASVRPMIPRDVEPLSDDMIDRINKLNTTWKAGKNFEGRSFEYVKGLMGVPLDQEIEYNLPLIAHDVNELEIPETFDARTHWPDCPTIKEVRDQGSCGSCWAFGAVTAMSDRICIASKGEKIVELSAEDMLSCCKTCGQGCKGGFPAFAWQYWEKEGIVSGGLYDSNKGCKPYSVAACEHHTTGSRPPCAKELVPTPKCTSECREGYETQYTEDKHYAEKIYRISLDVKQIQAEIMKNGPVEADYTVYADFVSYKSGVYHRTTDEVLSGHAVRILGWGVDKETPYWLISNSWNNDWGEQGFFRMKRGTNECGIETHIMAGTPKP